MEQQMNIKPSIPFVAKLIGILLYLESIIFVVVGTIMLVAEGLTFSVIPFVGVLGATGWILTLAFSGIYFLLARGLFRGQNWARKFTIEIAVLLMFLEIAETMMSGFFNAGILVNITIAGYLLFDKKVKAAFY